ncbi:MAG TPA: FHA domain-containing protein [Planctomycetaceae bacterium]
MPEIILRSGKRAGRRITLPAGEVFIGRDEGCRIRLTSSDVSRRHCLLRCNGDEVVAADLGSRNGTYVNDAPITAPTPLRPGDLLRIGPFLFQMPGAAEEKMSDEDISGWLTEEGTIAGTPPAGVTNDTTLMDEMDEEKSTDEMRLPEEPAPAPAAPKDPIIAQAAEIIREYWAGKKGSRR